MAKKPAAAQSASEPVAQVDPAQRPPSHTPVVMTEAAGDDLATRAGHVTGYDVEGLALVKLDDTGEEVAVPLAALRVLA